MTIPDATGDSSPDNQEPKENPQLVVNAPKPGADEHQGFHYTCPYCDEGFEFLECRCPFLSSAF